MNRALPKHLIRVSASFLFQISIKRSSEKKEENFAFALPAFVRLLANGRTKTNNIN